MRRGPCRGNTAVLDATGTYTSHRSKVVGLRSVLRCWAGVGTVLGLHLGSKDMGYMYDLHLDVARCLYSIRSTRGQVRGTCTTRYQVTRKAPEGAQGPPVPTVRRTQCLHPELWPSLTNCRNRHTLFGDRPRNSRDRGGPDHTVGSTAFHSALRCCNEHARAPGQQRYRIPAARTLYLPGA